MYKIIGADNKEYGPVPAGQIRQWIAERRLNGDSSVQAEGAADWRPLRQFAEFAEDLSRQSQSLASLPPANESAAGIRPGLRRTNSMAVAGFVMGILGLILCCCCYGFPFNVLGLVFSIVALMQLRRHPAEWSGDGLAWAGLVMSILSIALGLVLYLWYTSVPKDQWDEWLEKLQQAGQAAVERPPDPAPGRAGSAFAALADSRANDPGAS